MATIKEAIVTKLKANDGVTAIVGARIFSRKAAMATTTNFPMIVFRLSGIDARQYTMNGKVINPIGENYEFICTALDETTANDLADKVIAALEQQRGDWSGISVKSVGLIEGEEDEQLVNNDVSVFMKTVVFNIKYNL